MIAPAPKEEKSPEGFLGRTHERGRNRRWSPFCGRRRRRRRAIAALESLPASSYVWRLVILLSLGGWFEVYDLFSPATSRRASTARLADHHDAAFFASPARRLVAATFAGLFVAPSFLGFLADRFGRRRSFTFALPGYTAASVMMACQTTSEGILLWRFIAGIGIGVEIVTSTSTFPNWCRAGCAGAPSAVNQSVMFTAVPVVLWALFVVVCRSYPYRCRWLERLGGADRRGRCDGDLDPAALRETRKAPRFWLARHGRAEEALKNRGDARGLSGLCGSAGQNGRQQGAGARRTATVGFSDLSSRLICRWVVLSWCSTSVRAFGSTALPIGCRPAGRKGHPVHQEPAIFFIVASPIRSRRYWPQALPTARAQMDHLRRLRGDHHIRIGLSQLTDPAAADPQRRAADRGEHDDVLRLSRLSDRSVSDRRSARGHPAWSIP